MKRLLLLLIIPSLSFAGDKDVVVTDQPDELIAPLQAIEAQGEANRAPYTRDDQRYYSGNIDDGSTQFLSLAGDDESRLIEQIIVSVFNDAQVEILICVNGCNTPFNEVYPLAIVKSFQQLTFDRPIRAEQIRIWCREASPTDTNCGVNVSALMTPE